MTLGQDVETWYYCDASRVTHGPFDRATFDELRRQGVVAATDLVWRDGWTQWEPSTVLPPPPAARPAPPPSEQFPVQQGALKGSQPGSVFASAAEQTGGSQQTSPRGGANPNHAPVEDGRVECSECRLRVPVSSTKMLGGQVVCNQCQELIIKRLVKESGLKEPGSGELRMWALRVLAVVAGLFLLYAIQYAIRFKSLPTFGLSDGEASKTADWAADPPVAWPKLVWKVEADFQGKSKVSSRNASFVKGRGGKVYLVTSNALEGETDGETAALLSQVMGDGPVRWRLSANGADLQAKRMVPVDKGTILLIEISPDRVPGEAVVLRPRRTRFPEGEKAHVLFHPTDGVGPGSAGANLALAWRSVAAAPGDERLTLTIRTGTNKFPMGGPVLDKNGFLAGIVTTRLPQAEGSGPRMFAIERLDGLAQELGLPTGKDGKLKE